ncbi:serine/arginine repetitive matrix protein 1-like [Chenopodium quinoa]|uniref:serine/arginine repetitive matrix protein 1-like n=1 Tax=Chenopodium quinoa TaxID=63459 RepID=UPI000B792558|nr:serine/arginine repetitive matrix protein 1-like [Chenopodium quinoa]
MAKNRKNKRVSQRAGERPSDPHTPTPSPSPDRNSSKGASSGGAYREDSLSPVIHQSHHRPSPPRSNKSQSDRRTQSVPQSRPLTVHSHSHTQPRTLLTGPSSEEVARALAVLMEAMRAQNMPPPCDRTPPHTRHQRRKLDHEGEKPPSFKELEEWEEDTWRTEKERKKNPHFFKGSSTSRPETHKSSSSASRPETARRERPETVRRSVLDRLGGREPSVHSRLSFPTLEEALNASDKFIRAEEWNKTKSQSQSGGGKQKQSSEGQGQKAKGKAKASEQSSANDPKKEKFVPFKGRYESYTPLALPRAKIYNVTKEEQSYRKPRPLPEWYQRKNKNQWCEFRKSPGYNTEECIQLKDQIEDMVRR